MSSIEDKCCLHGVPSFIKQINHIHLPPVAELLALVVLGVPISNPVYNFNTCAVVHCKTLLELLLVKNMFYIFGYCTLQNTLVINIRLKIR